MEKIFSKEKFIEAEGAEEYEDNRAWVDDIDMEKIQGFFENGDGYIEDMLIAAEWMEEVEENGQ